MIKDSPVVEDIRRIRGALSEQFDHDVDKYIAYLQSKSKISDREDIAEPPPDSSADTTNGNCRED